MPDRPAPPVRRTRRLLLLPCLAALAATGCGNERTPAPDVTTPGPPLGSDAEAFPAAGLRLQSPAGWTLRRGAPPLVASVSTGRAVVSIFRYPRTEPLPRTAAELDDAAKALGDAARQRDPSFALQRSSVTRVDGQPAIVVRGTQTVAGQPRTVRSTHIYGFGGEVVVDAFAPARDFRRVDAEAFRPLVRSLKLDVAPG